MPAERRLLYWDSCVWLHYFQETSDYINILSELMRLSSSGDGARLVTSVLSIAEVAHIVGEKATPGVLDAKQAIVDSFWRDESLVSLAETSERVMYEARDLMRQARGQGLTGLKPPDAIHLATAIRLKAAEFHTYDDKLWKYSRLVGFAVKSPWVGQPPLIPAESILLQSSTVGPQTSGKEDKS